MRFFCCCIEFGDHGLFVVYCRADAWPEKNVLLPCSVSIWLVPGTVSANV
jgi:hypothetical protein